MKRLLFLSLFCWGCAMVPTQVPLEDSPQFFWQRYQQKIPFKFLKGMGSIRARDKERRILFDVAIVADRTAGHQKLHVQAVTPFGSPVGDVILDGKNLKYINYQEGTSYEVPVRKVDKKLLVPFEVPWEQLLNILLIVPGKEGEAVDLVYDQDLAQYRLELDLASGERMTLWFEKNERIARGTLSKGGEVRFSFEYDTWDDSFSSGHLFPRILRLTEVKSGGGLRLRWDELNVSP